jgi:hypothetical protein
MSNCYSRVILLPRRLFFPTHHFANTTLSQLENHRYFSREPVCSFALYLEPRANYIRWPSTILKKLCCKRQRLKLFRRLMGTTYRIWHLLPTTSSYSPSFVNSSTFMFCSHLLGAKVYMGEKRNVSLNRHTPSCTTGPWASWDL